MGIKLLIADDHEVVRSGLASLLAGTGIDIVGEARDGRETIKLTKKLKPEVVLLDIRMPEVDGLETLDKLHKDNPDLKIVMLSTYDNPTYMARAVALGASDYVLKGSDRATLISTIKAAAAGKSPVEGGELGKIAGTMATKKRPVEDMPLTNRESQVLRHVALDLSNKEIGQSLSISVETVKEHVQNILRKISVNDRTQAAVWAVRRGIV